MKRMLGKIVKTENGGSKISEKDTFLMAGPFKGTQFEGEERGVLFQYLVSDCKTYLLETFSFAGSESTGMIRIEAKDAEWYDQFGDSIEISREDKTMTISRWNGWFSSDTYKFDIDGWAGRYGKPLELLLSLHLATMTPDISSEIATGNAFNTKVNIGLHEQINYVTVDYRKNDGSKITPEEMRDSYIDLRQSGLKEILKSSESYDKTLNQFLIDIENTLGTYEELKEKGTTDKIEKLLNDTSTIKANVLISAEDGYSITSEHYIEDFIDIEKKHIIPDDIAKYFVTMDGLYWGDYDSSCSLLDYGTVIMADDLVNLIEEQGIYVEPDAMNIIKKFKEYGDDLWDAECGMMGYMQVGGTDENPIFHSIYTAYENGYGFLRNVYSKYWEETNSAPDVYVSFANYDYTRDTKEDFMKFYKHVLKVANEVQIFMKEVERCIDITMENVKDADLGLTYSQVQQATEINYGETGGKLTKESKLQGSGKGKKVETYQPYIIDVTDAWFRDVIFESDTFTVYRNEPSQVTNEYKYDPDPGSDSRDLVEDENGAFWITETASGKLVQELQPQLGEINPNTIKLFAGEDMTVGTKDDPKYYIYDGTKKTAQLIESSIRNEKFLSSKNTENINLELLRDFMDSIKTEEFLNENKDEIKEAVKNLKQYFNGLDEYAYLINDLEGHDDILDNYGSASAESKEKLNQSIKNIIKEVEDVERIHSELKKTISLDRNSLTAFSILENTDTLDAEFILRDLKELLIHLEYFTEDDFIEYDTNVLEFIVPDADVSDWPDQKVYSEDEEKNEKPIDEYYTGIRQERFEVGDKVIAPGTGIITDSKDDFVKIKFITPVQVAGMEILIEGINVDLSNTTNITYDGKTERKIEKGVQIGTTKANKIKIYLYDEEQSIINDVEEYMNPNDITKLDMVVKTDDERSPKIITDKQTLKRVIENGWDGDTTNLTSDYVLEAMLEAQNKYNVNALFLAAIAIKESAGGTAWDLIDSSTYNWCSVTGSYNGKSYTDRNGTNWKQYSSFAEAIEDCARLIWESENYFNQGKKGAKVWISTIAKSYCPPGTEWANGVASIMESFYRNVY